MGSSPVPSFITARYLTAIIGIGNAQAPRLTKMGLDSLQGLAAAALGDGALALKGPPESQRGNAVRFIKQARLLTPSL